MKKKIFTLFLTLVMMISIANPVLATETSKEQIPEKVQWLINKGWVKGRGNGLNLDKTITRAEVAKMAALISNYEKEADNAKGTQGSFTDVNVEHWANGYINVATTKGYVNGYPDKTFNPENPITNAEIITILSKLHPEWKTSLTEGKIWPTAEVNFAKTNNILKDIKNLDGKNDKNATRQDVFEMIYNLCQEKIRLTVKNAEKQLSVKESTKPSAINWWWNNGYLANREYAVRFYDINKAQLYTKYVYEGDRVSSINAPEVDGYKFEGWMDRDTGKYFEFNDRVYRDIDLIAKYSTDMAKIKPVEPKPVEPKPVEPKPVEPKPGELEKQIEEEANAQLKETIEKAKNALEENKNEPQKAAEELKKAIAKAEKVLSEGNVEAKTNETTTLNDARIKYLNIATETEKLNKLLEESLPLYQDKNVSNDFKKAYEEANKVSVNGESLEEVKEAISKLEKAIAKEKELNKQIEAEANAQLKETIEKAKKALKENKNEPAKAAEELKTAIEKAEKVLSEGNVEAKTNETTTLNDARRKYLDIATETEKLNKLLEESLPLYQDKNVSDEFTNAYKEANKVSVNGESLEEVKEAISKLEKAIAKEKAVLIVFNEVTELLEKARGLLERVKVLQPTEDPLDISDKDSYVEKQEIKDKLSSAYDNLQTNFEKFKKTRDINDVLPENSKLKEALKAFEGQIKKGQLTQEKLVQAKKELQENIDKAEKIKERFKKFNADPKVKELEKLVEEAKQILTSGKYKEILAEIFNLEKTVNIDMSTISNIEELTKKANELKDSQEGPKIRELLEKIEKSDEETRAYLDMKLLGELEDQYTAVTLKQEFNRLLTSKSATKEQAEKALLEYDDLKQEIKSKHKDLKKAYDEVLIKFFMIKYTVNTKPEDAKVEIIERETGTVINPRENKTYYLEKDRYYKLKVSKDNYITKETDINPLNEENFERTITLQELKGTLKLSDGENYTVEQQKVKIDKSKLQEKDSKYSVRLKVNSNNNDNVLYTLDSNDQATLDTELQGKVKLDSDGKFEFNKDLEVGKTYKAKASAKGYETLEFEIVIENGQQLPK
ncbi:MAG: S-layer homology domain-containing protein [Peptoniphilus sp.]|uniref:S-layer homology domain-containing protein n=1 Tax=Peptoniphilus sp. TaxID=1971214 RepID=UPI002A751F1B|nr:S-layer homology domain-containing protein [Peptoniphilus sp.]MDY2987495.1 S-layer homology domain-containing protein [Peptoniphilus sp.]